MAEEYDDYEMPAGEFELAPDEVPPPLPPDEPAAAAAAPGPQMPEIYNRVGGEWQRQEFDPRAAAAAQRNYELSEGTLPQWEMSPEERMANTHRAIAAAELSPFERQRLARLQQGYATIQAQVDDGTLTPQQAELLRQQVVQQSQPLMMRASQLPILQRQLQLEQMVADNSLRTTLVQRHQAFMAGRAQELVRNLRDPATGEDLGPHYMMPNGEMRPVETSRMRVAQQRQGSGLQQDRMRVQQDRMQVQQEQREQERQERLIRSIEADMDRERQQHFRDTGENPPWHADAMGEFERRFAAAQARRGVIAGAGGGGPAAGQQPAQPQAPPRRAERTPITATTPEEIQSLPAQHRNTLQVFDEIRRQAPPEVHRDLDRAVALFRGAGSYEAMSDEERAEYDALKAIVARAVASRQQQGRPAPAQQRPPAPRPAVLPNTPQNLPIGW